MGLRTMPYAPVVMSLPLEKPANNWITPAPQRISPGNSNKYPKGWIKRNLVGNAAIWGKYLWTHIAAIKEGSIKRMIFPPCPTMFIPSCFFKMFIMIGLLFIQLMTMKSNHQSQEVLQVVKSCLGRGRYLRQHQVENVIRQGIVNVNCWH